jgi:uncharacterized protein YndB with AHSA1/START domain
VTETTTDLEGALRPDGDRLAVRFERRYCTAAADLWQAVTDPARLARWFAPVSGDLRVGGSYRVDFGEDQVATGTVRECTPPHAFRATWDFPGEPTSLVSVRVEAVAGGSLLVLEHTRLPLDQGAGYGAGWHAYLDALGADLGGGEPPDWEARFAALVGAYRARTPASGPGA